MQTIFVSVWVALMLSRSQSCPTLCGPLHCSPPGSSVRSISQARILEWVAISFSRESSQPRDRTQVSCIASRFFTRWAIRKVPLASQLCLTLCDHIDCSLPGSSVRGALQARILELPVPSSADLPDEGIKPRSPALQAVSLQLTREAPTYCIYTVFIHL